MAPFSKEDLEIIRAQESGALPPAPQSLLDKMQGQAEANDALSRPGPARDDSLRISAMSQDELLAEFPGVLYADAYDEEDAERESDPALLEDRTMETGHGGERRQGLEPPPPPPVNFSRLSSHHTEGRPGGGRPGGVWAIRVRLPPRWNGATFW